MTAIVRVEGLSKKYVIGHQRGQPNDTLRDEISHQARAFARRIARPFSAQREPGPAGAYEEFWALQDVSFEVAQGERLGIIGRNGAGKSTLLKILSRITEPTRGRVAIRGRVASLLEVGTGFHPELTGRENIFLNGAVLGMSRAEILRKFDEIVDFSEIERFLDTPVKRYSSGMYVRLAFAVAAHLEPEILIVDEVLAVGDVKFQKKCLGKMEQIGQQGRTVLFVSHNMHAVRQLCNRAILLANGRSIADDDARRVIGAYIDDPLPSAFATEEDVRRHVATLSPDPAFRLNSVGIFQDGQFKTRLTNDRPTEISFEYEVLQETQGLHVYFQLLNKEGTVLIESIDCGASEKLVNAAPGSRRAIARIPANFFAPAHYDFLFFAGIFNVRSCFEPVKISVTVDHAGSMNQAFPGYVSPAALWLEVPWEEVGNCR